MISRRGSACMPGVTDADATRTGEARRRRSFGHLSRLSQRANERDTTPGERPDTGVTRSTFRFSLRVFVHLSVGGENENLFITPSVRSFVLGGDIPPMRPMTLLTRSPAKWSVREEEYYP